MGGCQLYSLLPILLLTVPFVFADSHSHIIFTTVTTNSTDYPNYYTTRTIDDITLYWYDSDNEVVERRVPWYKSEFVTLLDASLNLFHMQMRMQNLFRFFTSHQNFTAGFHYMQKMEGCTVYDNGTITVVFGYHYDGNPFLIFNPEKVLWSAEVPGVQAFADFLNQNKSSVEEHLQSLVNSCMPRINHLLSVGSCTLTRKEQPVVRVTHTVINNSTCTLHCRAYGHYPKKISMAWYRNEEPIAEALMEKVTLPLPDITYLTWLSVNVTRNYDVYRCIVNHSSNMIPFSEELKLSGDSGESGTHGSGISNGVIIAICLGVILLVFLIVFGSVSLGKCRRQ
ncbi:major histocompatibility complex class I-related gene protein-like [Gastrophryne carolinensis]